MYYLWLSVVIFPTQRKQKTRTSQFSFRSQRIAQSSFDIVVINERVVAQIALTPIYQWHTQCGSMTDPCCENRTKVIRNHMSFSIFSIQWWMKQTFFFDCVLLFALSEVILCHEEHSTNEVSCWNSLCSAHLPVEYWKKNVVIKNLNKFSIHYWNSQRISKQKKKIIGIKYSLVTLGILNDLICVHTISRRGYIICLWMR